ncbi:flavin reductase [Pandoraea terrae]|uniref:Flavin reductase n=1 Tax=Pandoraea terrae TaxID=1537710 RepID=A0A5E4ZGP2_9BURK|nr:flavin reductase [Pandoraea terrae]VVE59682.1 flavin reductase [Pandoraea terrae]
MSGTNSGHIRRDAGMEHGARAGEDQMSREPTNQKWFRQVLGQYPTGVCVITATEPGGRAAGMAVGSFTSVSLDPPLVAFLPDRSSTSWPKIESAGRFCVNILSAEQEAVCRRFASKAADKFEGLSYRMSGAGSPIIDDSVAWIDCDLHSVQEAGDHYIVVGLVRELQIESADLPLLFFQGGYGRFSPFSLAAPDTLGTITEQLRHVDMARLEMDRLASDLSARCIATARVDDELVIAASAGQTAKASVSTFVGQRLPFMPPTGSVFAAWQSDAEIDAWLNATSAPAARDRFKSSLKVVRERGYSLGLINEAQRLFVTTLAQNANPRAPDLALRELIQNLSYDPVELNPEVHKDVRLISVPVFGPAGDVVLALTLYEFPRPDGGAGVGPYIDRVREAAARVTQKLGGVSGGGSQE